MPNWVFNSLSISGDKDDIAKVKAQLNQAYERQHDSWNPETKQMEISTAKYDNPVFAFWNIVRPTDLESYLKQPDYSLPLEEQLKFQGNDWYSWNIRNWGTKWDVGIHNQDEYPETDLQIDMPDHLIYSFNTAWSPPFPAIDNLSKQYPNLTLDLEYQEEQGWGGEITFKNGEVVDQKEYETMCRECDKYNSMEWNEEDQVTKCKECGYEW
jgi:hypothetical protein